MSQTDNPYESPDSTSLGIGGGDFLFEGHVSASDIARAYRPTFSMLAFPLVGFGVIPVWMWLGLGSTFGLRSGILLFLVVPLLSALAFVAFGFVLLPKMLSRQHGFMLGDIRGELTPETFVVQTERRRDEGPVEYLMIFQVTSSHIYINGPMPQILPAHLFGDYKGAKRLAKQIKAREISKRYGTSELVVPIDQKEVHTAPDEAMVYFSGPIMTDELRTNKFRPFAILMVVLLSVLLIGFVAVSSLKHSWISWLWLAAMLLPLLDYRLLKTLRRQTAAFSPANNEKQQIAYQMYGWITDSGVTVHSAKGVNQCEWSAFDSFSDSGDFIHLKSPARIVECLVLHRRQFESNEQWQTAVEFVKSKLD